MNKVRLLFVAVGFSFFMLILGWAGDVDYCEQVILRMSFEEYDTILQTLTEKNGSEPSEREIAHWYIDHHK